MTFYDHFHFPGFPVSEGTLSFISMFHYVLSLILSCPLPSFSSTIFSFFLISKQLIPQIKHINYTRVVDRPDKTRPLHHGNSQWRRRSVGVERRSGSVLAGRYLQERRWKEDSALADHRRSVFTALFLYPGMGLSKGTANTTCGRGKRRVYPEEQPHLWVREEEGGKEGYYYYYYPDFNVFTPGEARHRATRHFKIVRRTALCLITPP